MENRYTFIVPGHPQTKHRPRFYNGQVLTSKKTRIAEQAIGYHARRVFREPLAGDIALNIIFYLKNKQNLADIDNLTKCVQDALNKIAYKDDRQISILTVQRLFDKENPRTEISIQERSEVNA